MYVYKEGRSLEEQKDGAYWERSMLALLLATYANHEGGGNGWYYDTDNNWDGWHRVLSIFNGKVTFHIPDDFDLGNLPQIEPNWDGHSTELKWRRVMKLCGVNYKGEA